MMMKRGKAGRKEMEEKRDQSKQKKKELKDQKADISKKQEEFKPFLQQLKTSSQQLAEKMGGVRFGMGWSDRVQAMQLPDPLQIAHKQFYHIEKDFYIPIAVSIQGSEEEAKSFNPDSEINPYQPHPLSLQVKFKASPDKGYATSRREGEEVFTLYLRYLPQLNVVEAEAEPDENGNLLIDLLIIGDKGSDDPSLANRMRYGPRFTYDVNRKARPFLWAQWLCGLHIPGYPLKGVAPFSEIHERCRADDVAKAIFNRVEASSNVK